VNLGWLRLYGTSAIQSNWPYNFQWLNYSVVIFVGDFLPPFLRGTDGPTVGTGQLGQTKVQIWYIIKNVLSIRACIYIYGQDGSGTLVDMRFNKTCNRDVKPTSRISS